MAELEDKPDYSHIQLHQLFYIKQLGYGQFGSVYLVVSKETDDLYALKSVSKSQIMEQKLERHLLQEKQVLELVHFPFIMAFYRTFKDDYSVYFLTGYIRGMELFDVIRDIGLLSTYDSQYYIGSMILGLEYMHSKCIIYRDLKPENVMVDYQGSMFIIDLGTAKVLKKGKNSSCRAFTTIGTPHYMAPEIMSGKGYSFGVDLWSVGICLYEFMCGGVPFGEDAEDPFEICEEILSSEVKFPQFMKDKRAKKLIQQLLNKVPELRQGGSYAALKAHPWFDNFDWDKLYNRELKPPYTPPKEKIISKQEIEVQAKKKIPIDDEIKNDQNQQNKKLKPVKNTTWDKDF